MKITKETSLVLALWVALCGASICASGCRDKPENLDLSVEQWRQDLKYLARTLPAKHANAFHYTSKERFEATVANLDRELEHLNSDEIWTGMARIVALVGDAHTYLQTPRDRANFPIDFLKIGNVYRVDAVHSEFKRALGARVVSVGNTPIEQAGELIFQMFSQDENRSLADAFVSAGLTIGGELHGMGIIPDRNTAQYTLVGDDGKEFTIQVHAQAPGQPGGELIQASKERPLSEQHPSDPFWCVYLANAATVYCNVRSIRSLRKPGEKMLKLVEQSSPKKLVVDLRQNSGGDYNEGLKYLVHPIRNMPAINNKGHLFVLIDANTFSAAMSNATHFRYQTNAILVGRSIGEKPNSYQEPRSFILPNSHLTVHYSTKFYRFIESGENVVRPDNEIEYTWEDYMAGNDPALEWVLHYSDEGAHEK